MAIAEVQSKTGSGTGTTATVTPDAAPTAGNLMVLTIAYSNGTSSVSSITQTNCTWTRATQSNHSGGAISSEVWTAPVGASPGASATINFSASRTYKWHYQELSGNAIVVDQVANSIDDDSAGGG